VRDLVVAYVGLGANLGEPIATVRQALLDLAAVPGVLSLRHSALYGSSPVDATGPNYVNAVTELKTTLSAPALFAALQHLENQAGRLRPFRNAPRTLDLDLLLFGAAQIQSQNLTVPHPRMTDRAFVLRPLHDLAPALVSASALAALADQRLWTLS
jgi:2-amino-4-hydroxy-6-hydroxymethyldihydropteridine diphosphokinase